MPASPRLPARLRSLRTVELFNSVFLPALFLHLWLRRAPPGSGGWLLRGSALALVAYVLVQGGLYWHLKLRSLERRQRRLPDGFGTLFRRFRASNRVLLAAYPLLLVAVVILGDPTSTDLAWGTGLYLLAVLEHVNYFRCQLMHDTGNDLRYLRRYGRLRRSALREDLEKEARRAELSRRPPAARSSLRVDGGSTSARKAER